MPELNVQRRWELACACWLLVIAGTCVMAYGPVQEAAKTWRINRIKQYGPLPPLSENEKKALELREGSASRVFQIGLAMTAVLWGLALTKQGSLGPGHKPELAMFCAANWLLGLSLLCLPILQVNIAIALSYTPTANELNAHSTTDAKEFLSDENVWRYASIARYTLIAATLVIGCTVLSVRLLSGRTDPPGEAHLGAQIDRQA